MMHIDVAVDDLAEAARLGVFSGPARRTYGHEEVEKVRKTSTKEAA
jgi:hypothetical protein